MNMHIPSRQNIFREMRDYLMIALGMIMYGIGWTVFLLPNDITTGGVPGIASLVYFATGLPVQYVYFGINFLLLLLAIRILGWKFSIKTIFAVFTLTSFLPIIQQLTDGVHLLNDQPFMACVIGASFCGGGIGIAFSIIRKSKFPQNPKRSVRFSGKRTKRSVQKRKARNTQKAETKVL